MNEYQFSMNTEDARELINLRWAIQPRRSPGDLDLYDLTNEGMTALRSGQDVERLNILRALTDADFLTSQLASLVRELWIEVCILREDINKCRKIEDEE